MSRASGLLIQFPILAILIRLLPGGWAVALPDLFDERFLQMIFEGT